MEDVQHMRQHGQPESYLLLIDSAKRDTSAYPSSNDYVIDFNAPFRNVFGLDCIDASIARTEYIVETHTNQLVFSVGTSQQRYEISVNPGDYNLQTLATAVTNAFQATEAAADAGLRVQPETTPYERSGKFVFQCNSSFRIYGDKSSISHVLGFGKRVYDSVLTEEQDEVRVHLGPYPVFELEAVYEGRSLRQRFIAQGSGIISKISLPASAGATAENVFVSVVNAGNEVFAAGTLDATLTTEDVVLDLTKTKAIVRGQTYFLLIECEEGDASDYVGIFRSTPTEDIVAERLRDEAWEDVSSGEALSTEVWVRSTEGISKLTSPYLADLTGERYLTIRCPNLEEFIYRERAFEPTHPGIALVRLGFNDFKETRYEFVSYPSRQFHPIKLSRLHIRLERPNGTLFDTKGINHTLLFIVRYWKAVVGTPDPRASRMLNPLYDPDNLKFQLDDQQRQHQRENARLQQQRQIDRDREASQYLNGPNDQKR